MQGDETRAARGSRGRALVVSISVAMALVTGTVAVPAPEPAGAWKPPTHIFGVEDVLSDLAADNAVTIPDPSGDPAKAVTVPADATIAEALRRHPDAFRAGAAGPDAYPDIAFGQMVVHPDTGSTIADDWLGYVWESAWDTTILAICFVSPTAPSPEIVAACNAAQDERYRRIAFATGFINHGLGDAWAHTWVNQTALAGGAWPDHMEDGHIAVKHVIVEGYVDKHRPGFGQTAFTFDAPTEWISNTLITSPFARANAKQPVIEGLLDTLDAVEADLAKSWIVGPHRWYLEAWQDDLYEGFQAYVELQQVIAQELHSGGGPADFTVIQQAAQQWVLGHLLSMIGLPDFVGGGGLLLVAFAALLPGVQDILCGNPVPAQPTGLCRWYLDAKQNLTNAVVRIADDLLAGLFTSALGLDGLDSDTFAALDKNEDGNLSALELFRIMAHPEEYLDDTRLFDPPVRPFLHVEMGSTPPAAGQLIGGPYDPAIFAPLWNSTVSAKLSVLNESGLDAYFRAKAAQAGLDPTGLAALYRPHAVRHGIQVPPPNNVGLGWIRSMDGDHQWRTWSRFDPTASFGTGAMWLYEDCVARLTAFPATFRQPVAGHDAFDGDGDSPSARTDASPPSTSLTVIGTSAVVGGTTYLGADGSVTVTGTDAVFPASAVTLEADVVAPGGANGPLTALADNPAAVTFTGPDGAWVVRARSVDGCHNTSTTTAGTFHVDTTAPQITLSNPAKTLYATDEFDSVTFSAADAGSGVSSSTATFDGSAVSSGHILDMFFLEPGSHVVVVDAVDNVTNASQHTHTFLLRATPTSLRNNVERAWQLGLITDPEVYSGLADKLDAAVRAHQRGQHKAVVRQLQSFVEQLTAQSGKGIDADTARRFTAYAADLIANYP